MIFSDVGSTIEGNTKYLNYALDISNGVNQNGTQIHLWNAIDGNTQRVGFTKTANNTYIIWTKCSNFTKVASLADNLCYNGINVHQWEYSNHSHDQWILEPVNNTPSMGVAYAIANYDIVLDAYPDVSDIGGNCTNFVSQCLLAGGWHQNGDWYCKRLNTNYHEIANKTQLNNSWAFAEESPWISAGVFKDTFYGVEDRNTVYYKGQEILEDPNSIWRLNYFTGDVIQIANNVLGLGILGDGEHSMYITSYGSDTVDDASYPTFNLTYQSINRKDVSLLSIADNYKSDFFIFYDFTN